MNNKSLIKIATLNSLGVLVYSSIIALFLTNGNEIFGKMSSVLASITFLMIFVLSATIVGSLILAKPIMLYIDGAKKEAVKLLIYTICTLFAITLIAVLVLLLIK